MWRRCDGASERGSLASPRTCLIKQVVNNQSSIICRSIIDHRVRIYFEAKDEQQSAGRRGRRGGEKEREYLFLFSARLRSDVLSFQHESNGLLNPIQRTHSYGVVTSRTYCSVLYCKTNSGSERERGKYAVRRTAVLHPRRQASNFAQPRRLH